MRTPSISSLEVSREAAARGFPSFFHLRLSKIAKMPPIPAFLCYNLTLPRFRCRFDSDRPLHYFSVTHDFISSSGIDVGPLKLPAVRCQLASFATRG